MHRICQHRYILLALIAFAIYVSFMSIGLDDFDSHTFALAIENPGISLVTVHASGFPVYLFISKLIQLIVGDTRLALTLVSAICGALGIVFVAKIGSLAAGEKAGLISAGLLLFTPGYWSNSEVALSDIPGISFVLLAIFLFLRAQEKRSALDLVAGSFVTGLLLGVRPHNAIPVVIAGIWAIVKTRRLSSAYFQSIALAAIAGLLAISMWLAPIASAFNGLDGYVNIGAIIAALCKNQTRYSDPKSTAIRSHCGRKRFSMADNSLAGGDLRLRLILSACSRLSKPPIVAYPVVHAWFIVRSPASYSIGRGTLVYSCCFVPLIL